MQVAKTIEQVRKSVAQARNEGKIIGFVPTMGALHEGHLSLIRAAGGKCGFVVVSIFVNPTQFGPNEDFEKYPRDMEGDCRLCEKEGADLVFAPSVNEMYPQNNLTWVSVKQITEPLCGKFRPGHFDGVTTVCMKLFNIVQADMAFFGQKDAQQALVITRMVKDTNLPLIIEICPTIRENDGLAMSSRNKLLSKDERADAVLIYQALQDCRKQIAEGQRDCKKLIDDIKKIICQSQRFNIDYVDIVDTNTLSQVDVINDSVLIAVAAKIGVTRLIDNIIISLKESQDMIQ